MDTKTLMPEIPLAARTAPMLDDTQGICKPITKSKKGRGRSRHWIGPEDFTKPPDETMLVLAHMKNDCHSWRSLADEINYNITDEDRRVSYGLVRAVTLGLCKSPRIDYALGIRQAPPPVEVTPCPECGRIHKQLIKCKQQPTPKGKRRFAVWLDEDEFERATASANSHPDSRAKWLMERV